MFGEDRHQVLGAEVEDSLAAAAFDSKGAGAGDKLGKFIPAEAAITMSTWVSWMKGMSRAASRGSPFAISPAA